MKKVEPRELAILSFNRRKEVELSAGDFVWVLAKNTYPDLHDSFCFFEKEDEWSITFKELTSSNVVVCEINKLSLVEVIARIGTRQYEILVDIFLQNVSFKKRIEQIEKNFAQLLCK